MKPVWQLCLFLGVCVGAGLCAQPTCFDELGCFSTESPWFSILRPFPAPQNPQKVNTTFFFHNRNNPHNGTYMQTWPTIEVPPQFDNRKPTYFITHGYFSGSDVAWFKNLTEAILSKADGNIFAVDWSSGSATDYCQAASNARLVGAEVRRVIQHLINKAGGDPSAFHLLGHSLGAHIMSYAAKNISGIARITALDPAQPGFQGKNAIVRLDEKDAKFIDVIHTDGRPFLPFLGLGMSSRVGHVDFFVNGGKYQPNCVLDGENFMFKSFSDIPKMTINVLYNLATCSHSRAPRYMAAAIKENCIYGFRYNATYASLRYENFIVDDKCDTADACTVMGLATPLFPALGNFAMDTEGVYPFCVTKKESAKNLGLAIV